MSTAANAEVQDVFAANDESGTPLPFRSDTFLGVCEAVGQDLGFNPNWLRVPLAALLLWNPAVIVAAYLGLGCLVALSRWLFPAEAPKAAPKPTVEPEPTKRSEEELAIAA